MSINIKNVNLTINIPVDTTLIKTVVGGSLHLYKTSSTIDISIDFDTRPGKAITAEQFDNILEQLKVILDHNHHYVDAYLSNCNCNCNCNCQCSRGTL